MKTPHIIEKIVSTLKKTIDLPITVKMRTGINDESINAPICAKYAESGGADAICVHGRTRVQMYSGRVDMDTIKEVKRAVKIPVIANGDITDFASAKKMLEYTGADGLAIGRGCVGNPFIFNEIACGLSGLPYTPPTVRERVETALYQLRLAIENKSEAVAVVESRKQIAAYVNGYSGAAALRGKVNLALSYSEISEIFEDFLSKNAD
jgi:nifR3 family TIM-barrel protein